MNCLTSRRRSAAESGDSMKRTRRYNQSHRKRFGELGENIISNMLSYHGPVEKVNNLHYDIIFRGNIIIEIKTTQLCMLRTGYNMRRMCSGWTIYKRSHEILRDEPNGYYALVLMIDKEPISIRFIHSSEADKHMYNMHINCDKPRIRLGALYSSMTLNEFIAQCDKMYHEADHV